MDRHRTSEIFTERVSLLFRKRARVPCLCTSGCIHPHHYTTRTCAFRRSRNGECSIMFPSFSRTYIWALRTPNPPYRQHPTHIILVPLHKYAHFIPRSSNWARRKTHTSSHAYVSHFPASLSCSFRICCLHSSQLPNRLSVVSSQRQKCLLARLPWINLSIASFTHRAAGFCKDKHENS